MQSEQIYQIVQDDFSAVDTLIKEQLASKVPLVQLISKYIVDSGGKRMRPLLVLLIANSIASDRQGKGQTPQRRADWIKLAAVIEFLHTATLLHDDVVDMSTLRRGRDTANAKWGNAPSVLVGDFLYSRSFQMMVQLENLGVMHILANATNVIAEGEVLQLTNCKNPDITDEQYMEVITAKTAMLFQAAAHSAAVLIQADNETQEAMRNYGLELGIAFQLVDDVLDYQGDAQSMGKNVGDDLAEGKPTLPLLYTQRHGSPAQKDLVRTAIREGSVDKLPEIVEAVTASGALDYTLDLARSHADKAMAQLNTLPEGDYTDALAALAQLAVNRVK